MKCAPGLERPNALVILAFEEKPQRGGRCVGDVRLGCRGECVERFAGEQGGLVDVGFYEGVGGVDCCGSEVLGLVFGGGGHFILLSCFDFLIDLFLLVGWFWVVYSCVSVFVVGVGWVVGGGLMRGWIDGDGEG